MAREFTRNMLIMLAAIMIGVVVITYFIADIINRSTIENITIQHNVEMVDLNSRYENFTDYCLQGSIKMDSAREVREIANYYFDFALYWFNNALAKSDKNLTGQCIANCTNAMGQYQTAYQNFGKARPYFETARNFTSRAQYLEVIGYYVGFSYAGQNVTMLRYNASDYLRRAAENLSFGHMENVTALMENFTMVEQMVQGATQTYTEYRYQIDGYLFFSEIREIPDQT